MDGIGELKQGKVADDSDESIHCQEACERQENILDNSEQAFPNDMFIWTEDFVLVVKKLFWSCAAKKTKYGYKRNRMQSKYSRLCSYYDKYFYENINITEDGGNLDDKIGRNFSQFFDNLETWGMNNYEKTKFRELLLRYSKENLVRITAYISSPYVTIYEKDVVTTPITLIANIGGLMGFCMGFSLFSLAEIIYYIFINPLLTRMEKIKPKGTQKGRKSIRNLKDRLAE